MKTTVGHYNTSFYLLPVIVIFPSNTTTIATTTITATATTTDNVGLIVGLTVGLIVPLAIVVMVVVILLVFMMLQRKRNKNKHDKYLAGNIYEQEMKNNPKK